MRKSSCISFEIILKRSLKCIVLAFMDRPYSSAIVTRTEELAKFTKIPCSGFVPKKIGALKGLLVVAVETGDVDEPGVLRLEPQLHRPHWPVPVLRDDDLRLLRRHLSGCSRFVIGPGQAGCPLPPDASPDHLLDQ